MSNIDEKAIGELSGVLKTWAESYGKRTAVNIRYDQKEVDIRLSFMEPVKDEDRKLVD